MGYLKKPILTNANERVKAIGGLPVHGSALTIELENGLRKTFVLAGDSGTGKSETIIAMVEQVIEGRGGARKVKSIELLSGDMLSLFTGDDGQIYLLGTESGDFMRMTDISENWQQRFRDKISTASKTNKDHPKNPRTTISRLCNENSFLRPTRVNMFYVINNFEEPPGGAFQEEENPVTLMTQDYPKGYRREKGTSGDQPNLFASVKFSKNSRRSELFRKYHETLDDLLGWDVLLSPSGKARNGILKFREVAGKRFEADQMVRDLFKGQTILEDDLWKLSDAGGQTWTIEDTDYDLFQNQYQVALRSEHGEQKTTLLDRAIFDRIYNPIASTYCGNPFIDPRGMESLLRHFGEKMKDAGVITGTLYTQLAVKGRQFSGPARASQDVFSFIQRDPRINERLQKHCAVIQKAITTKYGGSVFQQGIP
ncbi:MAG: hypothetical protein U1C97_03305, partial [Candidatus Gracilibacteria bacterium]|nr:hypothetical protein [Candidatus Gracilibacteria bacterium]